MRYLIGKGFIGSNLSKKLDVIHIPHDNIKSTRLKAFDYFYFCSSYGNMATHDDEDQMYKANVEDLMTVLKKIRGMKFKSFVFLSTSSVMLKTQTTYSRFKRVAEEILLAYMERHDVPICIIRPFTIYGPNEQPEHLIPTILRSCFKGEQMNFVSEPVHDYLFIDDLTNGIISLSEHRTRGIFQLGTGHASSNQEVLLLIEEISGKKANINKVNSLRAYDNTDWVSNNYKARGYGWLPKYTLRQGLEKVVEDYIKNPKKYENSLI
uniref:Putative NADH dehydrogenase n=1 Tax=viral metagenome TaxID=1070528 RepID=A0A6M3J317_9ZZZZ